MIYVRQTLGVRAVPVHTGYGCRTSATGTRYRTVSPQALAKKIYGSVQFCAVSVDAALPALEGHRKAWHVRALFLVCNRTSSKLHFSDSNDSESNFLPFKFPISASVMYTVYIRKIKVNRKKSQSHAKAFYAVKVVKQRGCA